MWQSWAAKQALKKPHKKKLKLVPDIKAVPDDIPAEPAKTKTWIDDEPDPWLDPEPEPIPQEPTKTRSTKKSTNQEKSKKDSSKTDSSKTDSSKTGSSEYAVIKHSIHNIVVEQRIDNSFINGTAMCVAHGKRINDWFRSQDTTDFIVALACHLGLKVNYANSRNSTNTRVSAAFPSLVTVKSGSPENGGGTWVHPDLAIKLAAWCSKPFEIEVIHWVKEWIILSYSKTRRDTYSYGERVLRLCMSDTARPWEQQFFNDFLQEAMRVTGSNEFQSRCHWIATRGKPQPRGQGDSHPHVSYRVMVYSASLAPLALGLTANTNCAHE